MPARDSFLYKTERPWPNPRLKVAAIVGHTSATSCRLWFRTAQLGEFVLLLYPWSNAEDDPDPVFAGLADVPFDLARLPAEVRQVPFRIATWDDDSTTVLDLADLAPDTTYRYALFGAAADGGRVILGHDRPLAFRTLPAAAAPIGFAFFSCHRPYRKGPAGNTEVVNVGMWDVLREALHRHRRRGLRFVLGIGDQVYVDTLETLDIWRFLDGVMRRERGRLLPDVPDMVNWYRDCYRGYWGFPAVRRVFAEFPTYMVWDDHEIADGWGSYEFRDGPRSEILALLPDLYRKGLDFQDGLELARRMFAAARKAYVEYEHSHNPPTDPGVFDYSFEAACCRFYVLDGRGQRDLGARRNRILGEAQLARFKGWIERLPADRRTYVFVVSAVPVLHLHPALASADTRELVRRLKLADDLRDAWECERHDAERRSLLKLLFRAAAAGHRVCILSGDVHVAAAYRLADREGHAIHQLTSSAITYSQPRALGWILACGVAGDGEMDGYRYERLALYTDSNFAMLAVDPAADTVEFRLYVEQKVPRPDEVTLRGPRPRARTPAEAQLSHSMVSIPLRS
ncbi:MAG: alkaline phosphatase family protein [Acidobacteria bacterium]|nr:alkaline phosphatase family protein [Acidobacteriota bacterium]